MMGGGMTNASETGENGGRRDGVRVIARAAELLRQLASEPNGLSMLELSERLGMPRSTVYRIAGALAKEEFVFQGATGKLRIGPALMRVAVAGQRDIRHEVRPFLERLAKECGETVDLAVLDGGEVLFIDQYISPHTLRVVAEIGARFPLHATANGKALLAALPQADAERLLPRRLTALTERTITRRDDLLEELARVRQRGIACDREEHTSGVVAVAVAVRDAAGMLAAISVTTPAARFPESEQRIVDALTRARDAIHATLLGS
jgi:DNA-binding IclR family transcriptional regulator